MKIKLVLRCGIVLSAASLLFAALTSAQSSTPHKESLQRLLNAYNRLSPAQKAVLTSGKRILLRSVQRELLRTPSTKTSSAASNAFVVPTTSTPTSSTLSDGLIAVSDPKRDFAYSALGGFRQNTSSSARCGKSVVVGFGDTEDFVQTRATSDSSSIPMFSYSGVASSGDGGQTFTDRGYIGYANLPANAYALLGGDPVVGCSSASRFYYASLLDYMTFDQEACLPECPYEGVAVSVSDNGGKTWADPVPAVFLSSFDHLIDKPWLAVDPTDPRRLYVTYTDFQAANGYNPCAAGLILIGLVTSTDGGNTWSQPTTVHGECPDATTGAGNMVTGSNVVVSPDGRVYVAYELFSLTASFFPQILFQRSSDHGQTFTNPVKISDVVPIGGGAFRTTLQAMIDADEFPMLAVDRSNAGSRGTLYVSWSDGRDNIRSDFISGAYPYSDVYVAKSTDSGSSFTVLPPISPTPSTFRGIGRDQFLPGIAVDRNGELAVCYYDRRNDPTNMAIDRYCSVSFDQGLRWQDFRASTPSWVPITADPSLSFTFSMTPVYPWFIFAGIDYDTLTTDFLLANDGFFGAFTLEVGGNPNIVARKF